MISKKQLIRAAFFRLPHILGDFLDQAEKGSSRKVVGIDKKFFLFGDKEDRDRIIIDQGLGKL
jgi:hypothetical protein